MILHIISSMSRGGRERQLATIIGFSNQTEHPSKIVYFNEHNSSYIEEYKLQQRSIKIRSRSFIKRLFELNRILKKYSPAVVYSWGNLESLLILLLKCFHNFKFINGSIRHGIRLKRFSHYFRTILLHFSPYIVANSFAGLKANNLHRGYVLYNGVNQKFLDPISNRETMRNTLTGIPVGIPLLISVANFVPYKDYATIIEALKHLKENNFLFFFIILGDGPMLDSNKQLIRKSGLLDFVRIMGNVENVSDYLKVSDVFIHSSKGEGCSNAILEAMAAGLPIIASNTGGTKEIVKKENGFLFEYKNHEQLHNILRIVLSSNDLCKYMGGDSRKTISKKFTVDEMKRNYDHIVTDILSR